MREEEESKPETTGRRLVYFAAERTLMAWIRASLGLMALGFVIDRFQLVLRQLTSQLGASIHSNFLTLWGGTILVLLGTAMAVAAALRYLLFDLQYRREVSTKPEHGVSVGVFFAVLVALMGVVIAFSIAVVAR